MTTLEEHRKDLARGRRLTRIAQRLLYLNGAIMVGGLAAGAFAWWRGWLRDGDATPAVIFTIVLAVVMTIFFVLSFRGQRRIKRSIEAVAAHPGPDVPETLQVGSARSWRWAAAGYLALILGSTTILTLLAPISQWLCTAVILVVATILFVRQGPAFYGVFSAYLDTSGLRLRTLGIFVPWTSVSGAEVKGFTVRVNVSGPVVPDGDLPAVWTRKAIRDINRLGYLEISTTRQEELMWVALRHRDRS
jgi:ABC-type uncharacterized transport system permease subunit